MSRKPGKGYYIDGEFVPKGSELDRQFRAELKGTELASRSELKRLFVLGRSMTHSLLRDHTSAQASLIPSHEAFMLWDYAQRGEHSPALLEVYALGAGRALLNGKPDRGPGGQQPRRGTADQPHGGPGAGADH